MSLSFLLLQVIMIVLIWWIQPYLLAWAWPRRSRLVWVWMGGLVLPSASLGQTLCVMGAWKKPIFPILLYYPLAMQFLRYIHVLAVGPMPFAQHFGLLLNMMNDNDKEDDKINKEKKNRYHLDFDRLALFLRSPPTVIFISDANRHEHDDDDVVIQKKNDNDDSSWPSFYKALRTAVSEIVALIVVCAAGVVT